MSDPFASNSKSQLLREAQIGLSFVAILLVLFVYVAYYRITGQGSRIPSHVQSAPVAQAVWPYENASEHVTQNEVVPPSQPLVIEPSTFAANSAAPAKQVDAPGLTKDQAIVAASVPDVPEVIIRMPPDNPAKVTLPADPRTNETLPPTLDRSAFAQAERTASKATSAVPEKHIARNGVTPRRSKVVDDPFVQTSEPVNNTIKLPQTDSANQIAADSTANATSAVDLDSSFSPDLATSVAAVAQPEMECPKPIVTEFPVPNGRIPKICTDPIQVNRLRSVSNSADFEAGDPHRAPNDFETENSNVKLDVASDFRPDQSSFDTQAGFYEKLSVAIPEPDLLTSPQSIPELAAQPDPRISSRSIPELAASFETPSKQTSNGESNQALPGKHLTGANSAVYEIKPGDSFWTIAQLRYGDGRFFRALYSYNEKNVGSFDNLTAGTRIDTPSRQVLIQLWPEYCPESESHSVATEEVCYYVTRDGDTLFEIAAQRLGQASRYLEILELNSRRLPPSVNHLTPLKAGVHVLLPAGSSN